MIIRVMKRVLFFLIFFHNQNFIKKIIKAIIKSHKLPNSQEFNVVGQLYTKFR